MTKYNIRYPDLDNINVFEELNSEGSEYINDSQGSKNNLVYLIFCNFPS